MNISKLFLFSLVILFSLFMVPNPVFAVSPSHQATVQGSTEGGTSCTFDVNVQASTDMIVVGVVTDAGITSVTDEDAQTYTLRASHTTSHYSYLYTTTSPSTNAANTVTISAPSGDLRCFGMTLSGVDTGSPIGNTGSNGGASDGDATDTITYSTSTNDSLIVHVCGNEWSDDQTWDTGKTETQQITDGGGNKFSGAIAYEAMGTAGSNDATCSFTKTTVPWSHAVIEVKGAATPAIYVADLWDIYESASTTLGSGTAVCLDVDLETADDCNGLQTETFVDSLDRTAFSTLPAGFAWSIDGTKIFSIGGNDDDVDEWGCSAFDVSTCSHNDATVLDAANTDPSGLVFSIDGLKFYVTDNVDTGIYEYTCTTSYDMNTCTTLVDFTSFSTEITFIYDLYWSPDGTKLFISDVTDDRLEEYTCDAYDTSTCSYVDGIAVTNLFGIYFTYDGATLYIVEGTGNDVLEYGCTSSFDVSTCTYTGEIPITASGNNRFFSITPDGTKFFITGIDSDNDDVSEYTLQSPLKINTSYRFELEVDNTGGTAGSPDDITLASVVGTGEMFGTITASDITSSGCSTNTDWTDSIVGGTDIQLDAGTTCSISASGNAIFWFIVTLASDAADNTATIDVSDGTVSDVSTTTSFDITTPVYVTTLLDVYESASTTLDSGTAVCTAVPLGYASTCGTDLATSTAHRFEWDVVNIGGMTGSPNVASMLSSVGTGDVLGSITATDVTNSGCDTNTDWTDSIVSTAVQIDAGTTCSILTSGDSTYWFIVTLDSDAASGTSTFDIADDDISFTSTTTTFTISSGNYVKSISDSLSITDLTTFYTTITQSDPLSITDSVTTSASRTSTKSDPISITDSITTLTVKFDSESDPISITDSITTSAGRSNTESDSISITDSVTTIEGILNTESDPISITDSITTVLTTLNTESDPISITDSITTMVTYTDSESDPLSVTDSVTTILTILNTESDQLSITDSVTTIIGRIDTQSDPISLTDSFTVVLTRINSESDPISLTDSFVDLISRIDTQSDPLSITDSVTADCTGCNEKFDAESDQLSITDSVSQITVRNIGFVEEVDVGDDDGGGGVVIGVDRFDSESDTLSIIDSLTTITSRFFTNVDQLSILDNMTAINSTSTHNINVSETINVDDQQTTNIFLYEPTGKVIWFKVADPTNSTKGGVFSYMCDSTEIVTGINGTGYVKCTTLYAPSTTTRGGVYEQTCPGGEYVSGIDSNGDLVCTALP